jgi:hypothetical protein
LHQKKGFAVFIVSFLLLTLVFAIPGTAAASNEVTIKAIPLYRCWNGYVHWYTTNEAERDSWLASGFNDEGITCYVSPVPLPNTVPLYKCMLYKDMYYATSSAERDAVVSQYGFTYQGIEGYVIPANNASYGDVNVNRWYRPEPNNSSGWEWLAGEQFSVTQRHHFYQVEAGSIPGYNYEGVAFRAWNSPKVLQRIKINAPNGGEDLKAGNVQNISWTSTVNGGKMNLYYAMDGPASTSLIKIAEDLPNNGSYNWTVPNKAGSKVVIVARWSYRDNETGAWAYASDTSDSGFSITGSSTIIKPGSSTIIDPDLITPIQTLPGLFPAAPTGLTVSSYLSSRLDLFWKDNSANETGFKIERRTAGTFYAPIATVGPNTTQYSDTSAAAGTTYYYRVKATGGFDSDYSNEASGVLVKYIVAPDINYEIMLPAPPSGLVAASVPNDPQAVKLTWQASNPGIGGYIIERKTGSGDWEMTSTVGADKTSVTESGLAPNQTYSYRVRAYKLFLNSDPSNTIVFNTAASSGGIPGDSPAVNGQVTMDFFIGQDSYNINGSALTMDVSPVIKESRTLLPIRFITEPIGAEIQWIDAEKKVIINQGSTIIELWIGNNKAEINGRSIPIDADNSSVMPLIINGRTMMPLRFIAENLGCEVKWIPEYNQIKIIYQQ